MTSPFAHEEIPDSEGEEEVRNSAAGQTELSSIEQFTTLSGPQHDILSSISPSSTAVPFNAPPFPHHATDPIMPFSSEITPAKSGRVTNNSLNALMHDPYHNTIPPTFASTSTSVTLYPHRVPQTAQAKPPDEVTAPAPRSIIDDIPSSSLTIGIHSDDLDPPQRGLLAQNHGNVAVVDISSDEDGEDTIFKLTSPIALTPPKSNNRKRKSPVKRSQKTADDSGSDWEDAPKTKKSKTKKASANDSGSDWEDAPKAKKSRSKKAIASSSESKRPNKAKKSNKVIESDDDAHQDEDDELALPPIPRGTQESSTAKGKETTVPKALISPSSSLSTSSSASRKRKASMSLGSPSKRPALSDYPDTNREQEDEDVALAIKPSARRRLKGRASTGAPVPFDDDDAGFSAMTSAFLQVPDDSNNLLPNPPKSPSTSLSPPPSLPPAPPAKVRKSRVSSQVKRKTRVADDEDEDVPAAIGQPDGEEEDVVPPVKQRPKPKAKSTKGKPSVVVELVVSPGRAASAVVATEDEPSSSKGKKAATKARGKGGAKGKKAAKEATELEPSSLSEPVTKGGKGKGKSNMESIEDQDEPSETAQPALLEGNHKATSDKEDEEEEEEKLEPTITLKPIKPVPRPKSERTPSATPSGPIVMKPRDNLGVSALLRRTGLQNSGPRFVGLSRNIRIAPLHVNRRTPPPPPPRLPKGVVKKKVEDDIDSEEEYEGMTPAQIARRKEEKRKAAWYSP